MAYSAAGPAASRNTSAELVSSASVTKSPLGIKPWAVPRLRLEPPRFNGENAPDWISRIQKYYNHHYRPLDDRLYLTQCLFDHLALDWREYWVENNKGKGWDDFLLAVKQRFDPDLCDDCDYKLTSARRLQAYQRQPNCATPYTSRTGSPIASHREKIRRTHK